MKRRALAVLLAAFMSLGIAAPAFADPPGAGDQQCKPGQTANPNDPPKRPGSCPGG
jgi:hypothetical protein